VRIYIDREDGVTIDDCERVSRQVSAVLDVNDPIAGSYILEVSSPGLDRVLFRAEHWAESLGELVDVRLFAPVAGRRHVTGRLDKIEGERVTVIPEDGSDALEVELDAIAKARIVPDFEGSGRQ